MLLYNIFVLGKIPKRWRNNPAKLQIVNQLKENINAPMNEIDGFTGCRSGFCT
jgi:hypothetical protein